MCHTCHLWTPVSMEVVTTEGKRLDKGWHCAIAWGPILQVDTGGRVDASAKEMTEVRKEINALQLAIVRLMGMIPTLLNIPPPPPGPPIKLLTQDGDNAGK